MDCSRLQHGQQNKAQQPLGELGWIGTPTQPLTLMEANLTAGNIIPRWFTAALTLATMKTAGRESKEVKQRRTRRRSAIRESAARKFSHLAQWIKDLFSTKPELMIPEQ